MAGGILVTGADGQLGRALQQHSGLVRGRALHFFGRGGLDISDAGSIERAMALCRPAVVINTAAYTAVDRAETEPEAAAAVNERGAALLAEACARRGVRLFHISTDYVYHNDIRRPLLEGDPLAPRGVYARTKLAGEQAVMDADKGHVIIRTSWLYGLEGHNFVRTMLRLAGESRALRVVDDQIGSPSFAGDLAVALWRLCEKSEQGELPGGVYNYANQGQTSWYGLAARVFEIAGVDALLSPCTTADYPTPAVRPPYSVLDTGKLSAVLGSRPRDWKEALAEAVPYIQKVPE